MSRKIYANVTLKKDTVAAIDLAVTVSRDKLNLPRFRSRADFVEQAAKHLLEQLMREAEEDR